VAEICVRAGVTKGAFYFHFPSKQALFLDLLDQWLDEVQDRLQAVRQGGRSVAQSLLLLAGAANQTFGEARGQLPLFLEFLYQARLEPAIWQATIEPYRRFQDFFAAWIEQGVAEGSLGPVDAQATARILVSMAVGLILQSVVDPDGADWPQALQDSLTFFVHGIERVKE
jgi:AcrR family transcriptional regulator